MSRDEGRTEEMKGGGDTGATSATSGPLLLFSPFSSFSPRSLCAAVPCLPPTPFPRVSTFPIRVRVCTSACSLCSSSSPSTRHCSGASCWLWLCWSRHRSVAATSRGSGKMETNGRVRGGGGAWNEAAANVTKHRDIQHSHTAISRPARCVLLGRLESALPPPHSTPLHESWTHNSSASVV